MMIVIVLHAIYNDISSLTDTAAFSELNTFLGAVIFCRDEYLSHPSYVSRSFSVMRYYRADFLHRHEVLSNLRWGTNGARLGTTRRDPHFLRSLKYIRFF